MRTFVLLPIAAAALAVTAAMGAWDPGPAGSRAGASDHERAPGAAGRHAASDTVAVLTTRPPSIAFRRYRAETCSGDYVCREDGAWEPATGVSAEVWPLTSDGF